MFIFAAVLSTFLLSSARSEMMTSCQNDHTESCYSQNPKDCADLYKMGYTKSDVYRIWPMNRQKFEDIPVYCDMHTDGGGWTVIQRRGNFSRPPDYFYKDWASYKEGFGNIEKDHWIGNEIINFITNQNSYSMRLDMQNSKKSHRYAQYDKFWIDDESYKYKMHVADYSGNAGDSLTHKHNNQKFSTRDQRNDNNRNSESCASKHKGGWWYFNGTDCLQSNLNGLYKRGATRDCIIWETWSKECLLHTEIKVRPIDFKLQVPQD